MAVNWKESAEKTIEFMFEQMPESKVKVLENACYRNMLLTSTFMLGFSELSVYKEGFYWKAEGCRSSFAVYMKDNDGELIVCRKPKEEKLSFLWGYHWMNEMPEAAAKAARAQF